MFFFWCGAAVFETISFSHEFVSPDHHPCFKLGISNLFPNRFFLKYLLQTTEKIVCHLHRHFCHKTQCTERQRSRIFTRLFGGGTLFALRKISAEFLCTVQLLRMRPQGRNVNFSLQLPFDACQQCRSVRFLFSRNVECCASVGCDGW